MPQLIREYFASGRDCNHFNQDAVEYRYQSDDKSCAGKGSRKEYAAQLVRTSGGDYCDIPMLEFERDNGLPAFDYSQMPEPFLSIAFCGDENKPITYIEEYQESRLEQRPVYYDEFIGTPGKEVVDHETNPLAMNQEELKPERAVAA